MSVDTGSAAGPGAGRGRTGPAAGALVTSAVMALAVVTGCGYAEQAPGAETIPRVERPRDITAVADQPCELLTGQQAARFGLDRPPRQIRGRLGNMECEWRSSRADVWVYISTFTNRLTLEQVYHRRESLPYFEMTRIGGYPAIVSRTDETLPVCDIDIKPAERQSVTVSYDSTKFNQRPQEGCRVGRQVAQAVLSNLPQPR